MVVGCLGRLDCAERNQGDQILDMGPANFLDTIS
jgi:hypothetical protein